MMVRTQIHSFSRVRRRMAPTIDEFRRYLQARRNDLDDIADPDERERVRARIDAALQEALEHQKQLDEVKLEALKAADEHDQPPQPPEFDLPRV